MTREELIIGFFEKGYCCDLDEVKDTCLGLLKENQELKKQVDEYKKDIKDLDNQNKNAFKNIQLNQLKVCNMAKQQKEFIKYLEKRYKDVTSVIGSYGSNTDMLYGKKDMIEEILQKYKEIIGDDK